MLQAGAVGPPASLPLLLGLFLGAAITSSYGGCSFPSAWTGSWFQSGLPTLHLNSTNIESKGECFDAQGDKFVVWDRTEDCYRCMVIHEKHAAVLQYKETYCMPKATLHDLCYDIPGDALLYSMFRKHPLPPPVACPFKPAPFTFSYNRGSGECSNPPSRAESCTDDSRLVLKYQACPDIESTESNVEELVCVATWKEGSTKYLVGRISQISRRSAVPSDEDQYRCFIYQRVAAPSGGGRITYDVAQSGDATCIGLQSAVEGSRTMRLTTSDTHHGRCRFPSWITNHHMWLSLDHARVYKFSLRNATLKIYSPETTTAASGTNSRSADDAHTEIRVVCHSILQSQESRRVQIVAHVTAGCDSGFVCMVFHKRDTSVIELQQPDSLHENTDDACRYFNQFATPYTTLIAPTLHPTKCPHPGHYTVITEHSADLPVRKKREEDTVVTDPPTDGLPPQPECQWQEHEALTIGCTQSDLLEFRSKCAHQPSVGYTCHGSWQENGTHYVIAAPVARRSTDALRYCLVYTFDIETSGMETQQAMHPRAPVTELPISGAESPRYTVMRLSGLSDSCHRFVQPGRAGLWKFNFTTNGGCQRLGDTSSASSVRPRAASVLAMLLTAILALHPAR